MDEYCLGMRDPLTGYCLFLNKDITGLVRID